MAAPHAATAHETGGWPETGDAIPARGAADRREGLLADRTARTHHREFAMGTGEMSSEALTAFLQTTLGHAAAFCRDGAIAFVCMDWRQLGELLAAGRAIFSELKNLCIWNKTNGGLDQLVKVGPAIGRARSVQDRAGTGCWRLEAGEVGMGPYPGEIRDGCDGLCTAGSRPNHGSHGLSQCSDPFIG